MFRAYLKIVAAFIVLGIVAAAAIGMFYAWKNYLDPSLQAHQEIVDLEKEPPKRIDVGIKVFDSAMDLMKEGDVSGAHRELSSLVTSYQDSSTYGSSRRIIGEINMDQLLSDVRTPGKVDYEVKSGDSLNKIASQQKTTVDYILAVNGLRGTTLQRGDRLLVAPLEFTVHVYLAEKKLVLLQNDKFFKEYPIRVERGIRPTDKKLASRSAFADGKSVRVGRPGYVGSEKWLNFGGVTIGTYNEENRDDEDLNGIFLDVADIEELYTILRIGTEVLIRSKLPTA